jgi:hypothetical protein
MGLFDSMCIESGLIIDRRQRLIPIIETAKDTWSPIALPIAGTNDRGGTMDVPSKLDPNMKLVVAFGKTLEYGNEDVETKKLDLEAMLNEIRGDGSGATYQGKRVSFSLVDGGVFDAIVKAVTKPGATAWRRWAQLGLCTPEPPLPNRTKTKAKPVKVDPTTKRLCEAILAAPTDTGPRKVYVDHLLQRDEPPGKLLSLVPVLGKLSFEDLVSHGLPHSPLTYDKTMKSALVELVRFVAWGTRLEPAYGEGQFFGYVPSDPDDEDDDDGWAKPYVERARKKYAAMPELLAVCDRNEKSFRARGAENDDDDDDDDEDDD